MAAFPTSASIEALVSEVVANDSKLQNALDAEAVNPNVLDYDFIDLNGNGTLQLVTRLDYSGRGISFYLLAVSESPDGIHGAVLDTNGVELGEISQIVRDLDHNGQKEIVVQRSLSAGNDRSTPTPYFEDIYSYIDGNFIQVDNEFKPYYRNVLLPLLQKKYSNKIAKINKLGNTPSAMLAKENIKASAIQTSIAVLQQFLSN